MNSDSISLFFSKLGSSVKSVAKIIIQSRNSTVRRVAGKGEKLIIMGNGPSLRRNIEEDTAFLRDSRTMAVNFAANADEFSLLRPDFYILADPHFFEGKETDANVRRLFERLDQLVDWDMTLFIPSSRDVSSLGLHNAHIAVERFNAIGVEGFRWLENAAFNSGRGMPRPRNVLIPAIMVGISLGFREIYIIGADHTWTRTLEVDSDNCVISVQPHFYKDNNEEQVRVKSVYRNVCLHEILLSMHLAFKSYHTIARYAEDKGIRIFNSTPDSFIDAFPRKKLI